MAMALSSRVVFDAGMFLLIGTVLIAVCVLPTPSASTGRLTVTAWFIYAIGVIDQTEAQALETRTPILALLGPRSALDTRLRLSLMVVSGLLIAFAAAYNMKNSHHSVTRVLLALATALVLSSMFIDDMADAIILRNPFLTVLVRWTHYTASAIWIGGLAVLLIWLRGSTPGPLRTSAVRRYSTVAGLACVVVAATGVARAAGMLTSWGQLLDTGFGRLLIAKGALFIVLIALGAINRFVSVSVASRSLTPLRSVGRIEVLIGAAAVAVSVSMLGLPAPA